jgi:hypothetical protein
VARVLAVMAVLALPASAAAGSSSATSSARAFATAQVGSCSRTTASAAARWRSSAAYNRLTQVIGFLDETIFGLEG